MAHSNPWLEYADCVSITFELQKKDTRMDTVIQIASRDITLCGMRQWASVVKDDLGIPWSSRRHPSFSSTETWEDGLHHIKIDECGSQSSSNLDWIRYLGNQG